VKEEEEVAVAVAEAAAVAAVIIPTSVLTEKLLNLYSVAYKEDSTFALADVETLRVH
jgi:hypothetical protein